MRIDAREQLQKELLTLVELTMHKIAFITRGNMFEVALLENYQHLLRNTEQTVDALKFIKAQIINSC